MDRLDVERLVKTGSQRVKLYSDCDTTVRAQKRSGGACDVWNTFKRIKLDSKDIEYVACSHCKQVFKYIQKNGTSTLNKHTRGCQRRAVVAKNQLMLTGMPTVKKPKVPEGCLIKTKSAVAEAAGICCVRDLRPFHLVAGEGFERLAQELINVGAKFGAVEARSVIPSEKTVAARVKELASARRSSLQDMYRQVATNIGVTSDLWKHELTGTYYPTVTAQHVDADFNLRVNVLVTRLFTEAHTGSMILQFTQRVLAEFGIEEEQTTKTTDNASNNIKAFRDRGFVSCSSHDINLLLKHTFDELPKRDHFVYSEIVETLANCIALVGFMKRSGLNMRLSKRLAQHCETRWNSRLRMLETISDAWEELKTDDFCREEIRTKLSKINFPLLKDMVSLLTPFKLATDALQAEKTPTIQLVTRCFHKVQKACSPAEGTDSLSVLLLKKRLRDNLHRLKIAPVHMAAQLLVPQWRRRDYDFAPADECRAFLEEKVADEARMLANARAGTALPARQRAPTVAVASEFLLDSSDEDEAPVCPPGDLRTDAVSPTAAASEELARYMSDPGEVPQDCDLLSYWRRQSSTFPLLSRVAKNILAIPASNTTSERSFSVAGRVLEPRRCQLHPSTVDGIMVLNGDLSASN